MRRLGCTRDIYVAQDLDERARAVFTKALMQRGYCIFVMEKLRTGAAPVRGAWISETLLLIHAAATTFNLKIVQVASRAENAG